MHPIHSYSDKKDEEKDRDRLIFELKYLRDTNERLREIIARYERLINHMKNPGADFFEELEIQRELVKSFEREMKKSHEDVEERNAELEVHAEELEEEASELHAINDGLLKLNEDYKQAEVELNDAKQQAELYLDLMGHDINNMLMVALGYLELAKGMPPGEDKERFLDKPAEVLQRSAQLIQNVKKLQKLHDGTYQIEDIDVIPVILDVQREYGGLPNKRIILNINGCEHCYVRANDLLHDVYANLITNAIKHTGDETDIIVDLDIIKDKEVKYCRVMVEDNGPGIPRDKKSTLFNRTLNGTNKAKGMGLGLYIVKTLAENYGGCVWVEDRIEGDHTKGTRFIVIIPTIEST